MNEEEFSKKWYSKCDKDYKGNHAWERLGLLRSQKGFRLYLVLRCTQCEKCLLKELEML